MRGLSREPTRHLYCYLICLPWSNCNSCGWKIYVRWLLRGIFSPPDNILQRNECSRKWIEKETRMGIECVLCVCFSMLMMAVNYRLHLSVWWTCTGQAYTMRIFLHRRNAQIFVQHFIYFGELFSLHGIPFKFIFSFESAYEWNNNTQRSNWNASFLCSFDFVCSLELLLRQLSIACIVMRYIVFKRQRRDEMKMHRICIMARFIWKWKAWLHRLNGILIVVVVSQRCSAFGSSSWINVWNAGFNGWCGQGWLMVAHHQQPCVSASGLHCGWNNNKMFAKLFRSKWTANDSARYQWALKAENFLRVELKSQLFLLIQ